MTKTMGQVLPVLEISDDCIVSRTGDYSIAFELIKPEIFTLSAAQYETYQQTWVKAMGLLPVGSVLHMQDWYVQSKYIGNFETVKDNDLDRASERFFHERQYLEHRAYLFLTKMTTKRTPSRLGATTLLQPNLVPEELMEPAAVQEFLSQAGQFERILSDSGLIQLRRLTNAELAGDGKQVGVIEEYCQLYPQKPSPQLRDIAFEQDAIWIGEYETLLYTLADAQHLPSQCHSQIEYGPYSTERTPFQVGFASPLGPLLDCNHIYNQYIFIEDAPATVKKMELRRNRLQSLSAHSRENGLTREAVDGFLNEAISGQKQLVKAHFNVFAWTDEKKEIRDLRSRIGSAIARMGAYPYLETIGGPQIWWAGIPGNAGDLPLYETFDCFSEQAACFLMPESNYRSSDSPFGIRLGDRISGRPLHVDLSDEPMREGKIANRNKFILGGSGSGKSFFTNHLVRSYYEQGAHIVILDIGNSYKGLCELVEGFYFTYTEEAPIRFNPFWLPDGEILDTEKKESLKTLLLALWKKDDETFLRSEYVALSNALQLYYEELRRNKELFPCFDTFYEFLQNDFTKILAGDRVKDKDFDMDNFLYVLRPFYRGGEYDYLLNATNQLELLQQRMIVFELASITGHPILYAVVTIIIMETFISKIRKLSGLRKVLLIEECWEALTRLGMSEYIRSVYKTIRKFFGEPIVVTQEVEDIVSNPIVKKAIIGSSDCKIVLDLSKFQNIFDDIQNLLGLTEKDKSLILSVNKANEPGRKYKEVFISLGNSHSKVYRTEVSPEEYFTYTTEEAEKVQVQEYAVRFGSFRKGVAALVAALRAEGKIGSWTGIILICGTLFLGGGCKTPPQEDPAFLPGIYVSKSENDFCRIIDTLVIRKNDLGNGGGYQVTRKSSFRRIKDGREMTAETQGDEWRAGYSAQDRCLVPANRGDKIRYEPESNKIYKRDFVYEKIE